MIADTSVWVQYLRAPNSPEGREVEALLARRELRTTGVVLAEIIQGARSEDERKDLAESLDALPYLALDKAGWMKVGDMSRTLRRQGRPVPLTDLAVAVVALEHDLALFTLDQHFRRVPGLRLHEATTPGGQPR
ncbi:MAG: PIN domain-containing protein [Chloroflexi bacterium]|nr:PIN domain-containing protein [Chloroflexota bacterium]